MKHEDRAKIVKNANLLSQALEVAAKQYQADAQTMRDAATADHPAEGFRRVSAQLDKQAEECRDLAAMFADMQE